MKRIAMLVFAATALIASGAHADGGFDASTYQPLTSDHVAHKVGDVLTVLIYEDAVAQTTANTQTNKQAGINGKIAGTSSGDSGSVGMGDNFTGGGKIERTGKLTAQITVNVTKVLPNGDLRIAGGQLVSVNDEKQEIAIRGVVRPDDISSDNTIISSRVSDAQITYRGKGILGEKQHPGLLSRFLDWLHLI